MKHLIGFQRMSVVIQCLFGPRALDEFSQGSGSHPRSAFSEVFRDAATATHSALVFQRSAVYITGAGNMVTDIFSAQRNTNVSACQCSRTFL